MSTFLSGLVLGLGLAGPRSLFSENWWEPPPFCAVCTGSAVVFSRFPRIVGPQTRRGARNVIALFLYRGRARIGSIYLGDFVSAAVVR